MCKILLIENNPEHVVLVRNTVEFSIKHTQFDIATSKEEFMEILPNICDYDIVLSDHNIGPDFTGKQIIENIQEVDCTVPIVIVSGSIGEEQAAALMRDGACDYLLKDNLSRLSGVVEREVSSYRKSLSQNQVLAQVNTILFKLAKVTKFILQHEVKEISLDRILEDFGKLVGADRGYIFRRYECSNPNGCYQKMNEWHCYCIETKLDLCPNHPTNTECNCGNELVQHINNGYSYTGIADNTCKIGKGVKSIACVPILTPNKEVWGFFGYDDLTQKRKWSNLELNALEALGAIFGTLVYKMAEEEVKSKVVNMMKTYNDKLEDLQIKFGAGV